MLEQIRLADTFVHYDDVQFDRGFYNRVQVKTEQGSRWITVPLSDHRRAQRIDEIVIDGSVDWRTRHRNVLLEAYRKAPYLGEMMAIVESVFETPVNTLSDVTRASLLALVEYFDLRADRLFLDSRDLQITGSRSERLRDIVLAVGGDTYITGHGAKNYLDYRLLEESGISVEHMNYRCTPYPQLHGPFTPYVTALDLIANCGKEGGSMISSSTVGWKKFLDEAN